MWLTPFSQRFRLRRGELIFFWLSSNLQLVYKSWAFVQQSLDEFLFHSSEQVSRIGFTSNIIRYSNLNAKWSKIFCKFY